MGEKSEELKKGKVGMDNWGNGKAVDAWVMSFTPSRTTEYCRNGNLRGDEERDVKIPANKKNGTMAIRGES